MTEKSYVFIVAIIVLTPIFLAFLFYSIYRDLKRKKVIRKLGKNKTIILFSVLAAISGVIFLAVYLVTEKVLILGVLVYLMSIYFILDKSAKILVKRLRK
jgi:uncharacterized membrane protein YfcA